MNLFCISSYVDGVTLVVRELKSDKAMKEGEQMRFYERLAVEGGPVGVNEDVS